MNPFSTSKHKGKTKSFGAEANAAVGQFTNEDGKSVKGIQAEAGVDAYIIEGEAKAGFKVFGLNIDASASAGIGLSAIAKVGVTSEAAQAKLKLGPVGIGLSVGL
ncbi:hypothetical protein [Streptococcus agalactiae]|uniref:hypothetical protein n=1 Tax=Streptococcus agalactiae TaxID=1311 RepID=UPI0015D7AB96|nr:hypothetical protein [Streptococcus agalactiae]